MDKYHVALWGLSFLYLVANVGDVLTTEMVIKDGKGHEANPVVAWIMLQLGDFWPLFKVVICAFVLWAALVKLSVTPGIILLVVGFALTAYAVKNNWDIWKGN